MYDWDRIAASKNVGALLTIVSAVLFGVTPALGKMTYAEGSNGTTLLFFRSAMALPILFFWLKAARISLRLTKKQSMQIILLSCIGSYATTLLLYSSYSELSVGLSTTLHFIYPVLTMLGARLIFGEKMSARKGVAVVVSALGVALSVGPTADVSLKGVVLALLSGLTYSFYILMLEHTRLRELHYMKIAFYQCAICVVCSVLFDGLCGGLQLVLSWNGYLLSATVAILVSVVAIPAFQMGVRLAGGTTAALLSTLEPLTSILFGILLLNESVTIYKLIGCCMILTGIILTINQGSKQKYN